jgi:SAM-dependent methyltransferase
MTERIVNEHFVPSMGVDLEPYLDAYADSSDISSVHHVVRYVWAVECLGDLQGVTSVLDVACGAGYGSFMIASRFPGIRVVGADYDPGALEEARRSYRLDNLEFRHGDGVRWAETVGDEVFDCIVSFETIEHVEHRELFMENLVEHLAADGRLFLSTPCAWHRPLLAPEWEFHKIEYSPASLYDFLRRYFATIRRPEDGSLPHVECFDRLRERNIPYLLRLNPVICEEPITFSNPYAGEAGKRPRPNA